MVRHVRDPWAKKTRKGMKSLGKIVKVGDVLGTAAYYGVKSAYGAKSASTQSQETNLSIIPPIGWIIFLIGVAIGAIVMATARNILLGLLCFFWYFVLLCNSNNHSEYIISSY